jgi:ribosomal protein L9
MMMMMMMMIIIIIILLSNMTLCYKTIHNRRFNFIQYLAKDIKKVGKDQTRVRLLIDIKDVGKKGQIVIISNVLYMNSLGPKKHAEKVTDDEMNKLEENENIKNKTELDNAISIQNNIKQLNTLILNRKKGKEGQLFGAVTTKNILEELRLKFGNDNTLSNSNKHLIVSSINPKKSDDGKSLGGELINNEIRKAGCYLIELKLHPKVSTTFELEVNSE